MALDTFGFKMVVIAPVGHVSGESKRTQGPQNIFVIASYPAEGGAEARRSVRESLSIHTNTKEGEIEDLGGESITVGGSKVDFRTTRTTPNDGSEKTLQYVGVLPAVAGRQTMLLITGLETQFDRKAMDALLGSIK